MPAMPRGRPWASVRKVLAAEAAIRGGRTPKDIRLAPYWNDVIRLLKIYRFSHQGRSGPIAQLKRQMSSKAYRPYIELAELRSQQEGRPA